MTGERSRTGSPRAVCLPEKCGLIFLTTNKGTGRRVKNRLLNSRKPFQLHAEDGLD